MPKKNVLIIGLMLILFGAFEFNDSYAQQPQSSQAYSLNPDLCALMLRKGKESFTRGKYTEAKELFRKAILADPNSQKAWSYYDLAQMYSVAEQFKNHGRIVQSSAPPAEQTAEITQSPTPVVTFPSPETQKKGQGIVAKKGKPAVKKKAPATQETPKVEPATPGTQTPTPGGMKILKDEGC
ncbi:MAG: hypothetical protein WA974_12070 [Thermodesulfobacteriota bacterium]